MCVFKWSPVGEWNVPLSRGHPCSVCVCHSLNGPIHLKHWQLWDFLGGSVVKNLPAVAGGVRDMGSIPGSGSSPRKGNGNPLQYSCLEDPMDRGAWWATVHGVTRHDSATEHARLLLSKQWYLQAQKDMLSFPARTCFEDMKKPVMF